MMWPMHLDMSRDECKRVLRRFELEAYSTTITALRAQGELTTKKRKLLQDLASQLNISMERHKAEVRRAVNDEKLTTIAEYMGGPHTSTDWEVEGRRLIPLMPRLVPQTAFTALANNVANITAAENAKLPTSTTTSKKEPTHDMPTPREPNIPEATRTPQSECSSPIVPGATILPSGPPIKSNDEEEENLRKRRRSGSIEGRPLSPLLPPPKMPPPSSHPQQPRRTVSYPMNMTPIKVTSCRPTTTTQASSTQKVIIVSSPANSGPPSILQRSLSVPIVKTVATTSSSHTTTQQRGSSLIVNNLSHSSSSVSNIVTISTNQSTGGNLTSKTAVPIDGVHATAYITSNNSATKTIPKPVLFPNKPRPRTSSIMIPMTRNHVPLPPGMQRATLRATRPHLQAVKQDITPVKLVPAAYTTAKILPKPNQSTASSDSPIYVMSTSTTTLPIQSRTVPVNSTSRLITVNTSSTPKQLAKSVQTVHVRAGSPGLKTATEKNLFLVHKSGSLGYSRGVPFAPGGKEALGKLVFGKNYTSASMTQPLTTVTVQKPSGSKTVKTTNNQQPIQLSGTTSTPANVLMIDLSKEQLSKNSVLAEILEASGIFGEGSSASESVDSTAPSTCPADESNVLTEESVDGSQGELTEEVVICEEPDSVEMLDNVAEHAEEDGCSRIVTLEEAVALLGHSDSAETRALLRQAGIEVTDTVASPDGSPPEQGLIDNSIHQVVHEEDVVSAGHDSILEVIGELDPQTGVYSIHSTERGITKEKRNDQSIELTQLDLISNSKPASSVDIFSTALASADINLEAFQYMEEDDIDNQLQSPANTESTCKTSQLTIFTQSATKQILEEPVSQQSHESTTKASKENFLSPYMQPKTSRENTAVRVEPSDMDTTEMHLQDFTSQRVQSYENI